MNLSESCFNDIVSLVEEYINKENGLAATEKSIERNLKKKLKGLEKEAKSIAKEKAAPEDIVQRISSHTAPSDLIFANHDKQSQIRGKLRDVRKKKRYALYGY